MWLNRFHRRLQFLLLTLDARQRSERDLDVCTGEPKRAPEKEREKAIMQFKRHYGSNKHQHEPKNEICGQNKASCFQNTWVECLRQRRGHLTFKEGAEIIISIHV